MDHYYFIKNFDGSYVPIDIAGLFPGEKLTITLSFTNKTKRSLPYRLVLEDFDDSNDGTFIVPNGEENIWIFGFNFIWNRLNQ